MSSEGERAGEPMSDALQPATAERAVKDPETSQVPRGRAPERAGSGGEPSRESRGGDGSGAGRLLGGRYRLVTRLGHGGMGTVWRAHDEVVDRDVAVKEPRLPKDVAERQRAMVHERMRREARAAARIAHPSVVTIHDVVIEDGQPWLVMELVRGESLADVLETGTLAPREAARIGLAVLDALDAAHGAGVLHRDVKPANVLLGQHGRVILTDFGIAQVEGEPGLTDTGAFVGSPEYTSPERAQGQRPGPQSDLWSLGVLLFTAVEGFSPFRRSTTPATVQAVLTAEAPRPARCPQPLADLVTRLLAKQPAARPDAAEVRAVLREFLAAPEPGPGPEPTRALSGAAGGGQTATVRLRAAAVPASRKGRLALAGGLAAAAVAAAGFAVVNPFGGGGPGLPEGWRERTEDSLRMDIAVPASFERTVDPDSGQLTYASRDGIYAIEVWLSDNDPDESPLQDAVTALEEIESDSHSEVERGTFHEAEFQGRGAAELEVVTRPRYVYDEEDDRLSRRLALFYATEDGSEMWQVRVSMPGERGPARDYGEELYATVLEHLELREPQEGAGEP